MAVGNKSSSTLTGEIYVLSVRRCLSSGTLSRVSCTAVLTRAGRVTTVVSTAPRHTLAGVGRGARLSEKAKRRTKPFGRGLRVRKLGGGRRAVLRVRAGKVRWVAVTSARSRSAVRAQTRAAGLR